MPLDIAASHPDGMALQLDAIQAKPTETVLTLTITNNGKSERILNGRSGGTYIFGPDGAKLILSPPAVNEQLSIPPGQSLKADLVFQGALAKGGAATLITNNGEDVDNEYTRYPGFRVAIPMQDAAFTEGGSKKKLSSLRLLPGAPAVPAASKSQVTAITQLRSELKATETDRGTLVSLPGDVLFDSGKADIRPAARPTLDKLATLIGADQAARITIEGHTDSKGDDAYNLKLSERRAQAVRDYLKDVRGVAGNRMTVKGFGEDRPVAQNMTPDGRENADGMQKNRRVEVVIGKS